MREWEETEPSLSDNDLGDDGHRYYILTKTEDYAISNMEGRVLHDRRR